MWKQQTRKEEEEIYFYQNEKNCIFCLKKFGVYLREEAESENQTKDLVYSLQMFAMSALKKASRTKSLSLSQDDFIFPRAPRAKKSLVPQKLEDTQKIFKYIDENVIGKGVLFLGPFGRRKGELTSLVSSINFAHTIR